MKANELQPLSSSELAELGRFLESVPSAMTLYEAEGFLAGIATAPTTIMPSDWQPSLVGDHTFSSIKEAERVLGLIMRFFNEILTGLNEGRADRPSGFLDQDQLREWCGGYLEACRMDPVWWDDEYGHAALITMGVLAGEFDLVGEEDADGKIIEDASEHIRLYQRTLPEVVLSLHEYWIAWRRGGAPAPGKVVSPKVGRNDPCPCGSGRKYKKCCSDKGAGSW